MTDSLFGRQGAPYGNFKGQGTHYEGRIVRLSQIQSRKFVPPNQRAAGKQGELEFWPDGKPKMTAIVTIQTDQRDPSVADDDGQRSLWIKGKSMTDSVKDAIRDAGASRRGLEVGGYFSMTFTHETAPEFEGGSPTKHYAVAYTPPDASQAPQDAPLVAAGTPVADQPPQAPQQAPAGQAGPAAQFDVSNLTPQARAALEAMLAQQQGGGQQ
jgi:hypothetical protein